MATIDELSVLINAKIDASGFTRGEAALAGFASSAARTGDIASQAMASMGEAATLGAGRYVDGAGRMREANGRFVSSATLAAEAAASTGGAFAGAGAQAQALARGLNGSLVAAFERADEASDELGKGIGRLGENLKTVGAGLTAAVTLPIAAAGVASLAAAGDLEALEKGFAATLKPGEDLATNLAKVQELAKLPGLGLKEAEQGATNLQAAGFSADLARRSLGAFGNALATVGKGKSELEGVSTALTQIASKGKISAEEINQLAERVPQIRAAMQAAFGTADTEVLQKAGIGATEFVEKVTAELEKLPKVFGGLNNAQENFSDSLLKGSATIGAALNKAFDVEGIINKAGDFIAGLAEQFEALAPSAQKAVFVIAGIAAAAGPVIFAVGAIGAAIPAVTAGFAALGVTSLAALAPIALAAAGVAAAALVIYENWDQLRPVFTEAANTIGAAIGQIRDALASIEIDNTFGDLLKGLNLTQTLVREIAAGVRGLADTFSGVVGFVTSLLNGDLRGALEGIRKTAEGLLAPLANLLGFAPKIDLKGTFNEALRPIEEVVGLVGGDLAGALDKAGQKAGGLSDKMAEALARLRQELRDNENASLALGDKYDFIGGKAKILESGIKSLTDVGFAPAGRTVQGFVAELNGIPEAVDRAVLRVAKGLESLNKTPEFKLQMPDALDLPQLPQQLDANLTLPQLISLDQAKTQGEAVELMRQNYNKLTDAQKLAYQGTLDFNVGMEAAFDQLGTNIGPLLADFAVQFGDAFGSIIAGTASAGDAMSGLFGGILQSIGGFMSQFGAQLIAIGIGKVGLDNLFKGAAGGPLAIAAGIGLVALGGIASAVGKSAASSLGKIGSGGGGGSIGGSAPRPTSFTPTVAPSATSQSGPTTITHNVQFALQGNQLVGALAIETDRLGRVRGR